MERDARFIETDPSVGRRKATDSAFKVDANGVPLDIVARQKENQKVDSNDITNDPMFAEMFGSAGVEVKDPWKKGGNEDHWITNSAPAPVKNTQQTQKPKEEIPLENTIVPSSDPNDITNDPKFKEMMGSMEANNESDSSDSHMIK